MKKKILLFIIFLSLNKAFADSPLTSTDFYQAYFDIALVKEAHTTKKITNEMMEYIVDDANSLDIKLAIINAVGWDTKIKMSKLFFMFVMNKRHYQSEFSNSEYIAFQWSATRDELICYSYMKALDNYFDVADAYEMACEAQRKFSDSFAVNMICYLIKSQGLTTYGEHCYASKLFQSIKDKANQKMDMRKEAMPYIFEYMISIGDDCEKKL